MKIRLFTIVFFIFISSIYAQKRKETIDPNKFITSNIEVKSTDAYTSVTVYATATELVDMYIMNPAQFVEYSALASKGVEFEYDKENSRIGVKNIELILARIYEDGSKVVLFNPGNSTLNITYEIETYRGQKGRNEYDGFEALTIYFNDNWYWIFPVHILVMLFIGYFILLAWAYILRLVIRCIPFEKIMSFKQALGLKQTDAEDNTQYTTHDIPTFFKMCEEKRDESRDDQMEYNNFENELRNERMKYNNFEDSEEMPEFFKNCNENRGKGNQKRNSKMEKWSYKKKKYKEKWIDEKKSEKNSEEKEPDKESEIFIEPPSAPIMNESFFNIKLSEPSAPSKSSE